MANEVLKEAFQALHSDIATSVNPDSVMDALFSKTVLSSDDYYKLRQVPVSRDRCRDMMSLLYISKHPQAFIHLRLTLLDEYPWIVDEIDQKLASLASQMQQLHLGQSTQVDKIEILPVSSEKNPLHEAIASERFEDANRLIKSQREAQLVECFKGQDGHRKSCLHLIAAISDKEEAIKLCRQLLRKIENVLNREHLLHSTTVEKLCRDNVEFDVRVAAIHMAAYRGNAGLVRVLCQEFGVDVNCNTSETLHEEPRTGITPLMLAAQEGHIETVKLLLDHKADVNAGRTNDGVTALHWAANEGHTETVRLLLDRKADVNAKCTSSGVTALPFAAMAMKLLLGRQADVNARYTDKGQTALHAAAWNGHTETVKLLLDRQADVNARRTDNGQTALHQAAWNGHTETVKLLIVYKADVNARTTRGNKPIDLARQENHSDVVKLLT